MGAEDFQPKDRLTVAKRVVEDFVAGRPGDRIGLVVFSGGAMTRAPLTTDRDMLATLIRVRRAQHACPTAPRSASPWPAPPRASRTARPRPRSSSWSPTAPTTPARSIRCSAAALCRGLGLKVYTIGVGSNNGPVPVPLPGARPGDRRDRVTGRVHDERAGRRGRCCSRSRSSTGGPFYKATDSEALRRIFQEIDRLEKTPLKVKRYVRYREAFPPLAWAGLALLLLPLAAAGVRMTAEP